MRPTEFDWDRAKAERNLEKHGLSFEFGAAAFLDSSALVVDVTRAQDGERREKAIAEIEGRILTVVFTMRDDLCRLISVRRANRKEIGLYNDHRSIHA